MRARTVAKPTPEIVRVVSYLAAFLVLVALVAQLLYSAVLVPLLPSDFELDLSSKSPTSHIMVTPGGVAIGGWTIVILGGLAAAVSLIRSRSGSMLAYACGAIASVVLPGFAAGLLANAFAALNGADGSSGAPVFFALGCAVGALAVLGAPRLARQLGQRAP